MDWLRSEDLKEEKNVTAPSLIVAVQRCLRSIHLLKGKQSLSGGPDWIWIDQSGCRFWPTLLVCSKRRHLCRRFPEIPCVLCGRPLDLQFDLSADERIKAARLFTTVLHLYTKRLPSSFRNPAAINDRSISTATSGGGTETDQITHMARVMSVLLNFPEGRLG